MIQLFFLLLGVGLILYLLYYSGILVFNSKRAAMFNGSQRGNKARFASCSGSISRVIRFRSSGPYRVVFSPDLLGGAVSVEIRDSHQEPVVRLDDEIRIGVLTAVARKPYYLTIFLEGATGSYTLDWKPEDQGETTS